MLRPFSVLFIVITCLTIFSNCRQRPNGLTRIRIAGTPHQDTTLYMWGMQKGYFRDRGLNLEICDTTFNEQIEAVAGGGCDIAMATVGNRGQI